MVVEGEGSGCILGLLILSKELLSVQSWFGCDKPGNTLCWSGFDCGFDFDLYFGCMVMISLSMVFIADSGNEAPISFSLLLKEAKSFDCSCMLSMNSARTCGGR